MHKIIIHDNKACQFVTDDADLFRVLRSTLSYKMSGVEYTAAYKNGWNGMTFLINKKGYFFYGLLFKVEEFLKERHEQFIIEDLRPKVELNTPIDLSKKLKKMNMVPRDYQDRIVDAACNSRNGIVRACTGSGKAQPLDAKILTPDGWITMGEITTNAYVIGSDGKPKRVLEVFPQGKKEIYRITFSDGTSTECCDDHLWYTSTHNERRHKTGSVKSLKEIRSSLKYLENNKNNNSRNHSIPTIKPVMFNTKDIIIDPYLLGVLLGDGGLSTKNSVSLSSADNEIIDNCINALPKTTKIIKKKNSKHDYYVVGINKAYKKNDLINGLRKYNLMGLKSDTKFIPDDYLYNSVEIRLSILQGLMDTDGFCSKDGKSVIFYSTSQKLSEGVRFIIQSLGGKAVIRKKQTYYTYKGIRKIGKNSFAVHISMPENIIPFRLIRKKNLFIPRSKYQPIKYFDKIELIGEKEAQCILIDSKDHLYVTDDFILTHNTLCTALIAARLNKPTIIYVIGLDLLKQFHDLFSELFSEPIGYIGDGVCKIERINIASIWTIGSALNIDKKNICTDDEFDCEEKIDVSQREKILALLEQTKIHIFDECHVVTCDTIQSIHKKINPEYIYGFSGTPYRDDNTDLLIHGILGNQIVDVSASELIDKKILAQPIIKFIPVPHMSMPLAQYQTVYKSYITENAVRNMIIIQQTKELLDKKYTPLILFKHIKHGQTLYEMMSDAGIKCEMLYGNDSLKRRTEVKEMLEKKEISVILASTIFDLGINLPVLSALVLAGGGKSSIRALQRIGRIIRRYPGKTYAVVVDFFDQIKFLKKHSNIRYDIYSSEKGFKVIKCKEMKAA